ncbi:MAG: class I SAM-dependent methyltransferase [Bacteroidota bacterium]
MGLLKYDISTHLDDPVTTTRHRELILSKPFLRKLYAEWYDEFARIAAELPPGKLLEIGSGGGFLKDVIPGIITSDILPLDYCDMTFSAEQLPFGNEELSGIFMLNVFHHIPRPHFFLKEAQRVLKKGGRIVMIEPANTLLSRFIYKNFHHEPFDPRGGWEIQSAGPLSDSNQALPYIYFIRDREKYRSQFPLLQIRRVKNHTPFRYVLSGGVSRRAMVPAWSFGFFRSMESVLSPLSGMLGLFVTIELEKAA